MPTSADGRFALDAELHEAAVAKVRGRFELYAHLRPGDAKTIATACGSNGVTIFSNGFEN